MDDHSILPTMVASALSITISPVIIDNETLLSVSWAGLLPYIHCCTGGGNDLGLDLIQRINQHVAYQLMVAEQPPLQR